MVGSTSASMTARVSIKMFPEGDTLVTVEYPIKKFVPAVLIQVNWINFLSKLLMINFNNCKDQSHLVGCGLEKGKPHLYVFNAEDGELAHKILTK